MSVMPISFYYTHNRLMATSGSYLAAWWGCASFLQKYAQVQTKTHKDQKYVPTRCSWHDKRNAKFVLLRLFARLYLLTAHRAQDNSDSRHQPAGRRESCSGLSPARAGCQFVRIVAQSKLVSCTERFVCMLGCLDTSTLWRTSPSLAKG